MSSSSSSSCAYFAASVFLASPRDLRHGVDGGERLLPAADVGAHRLSGRLLVAPDAENVVANLEDVAEGPAALAEGVDRAHVGRPDGGPGVHGAPDERARLARDHQEVLLQADRPTGLRTTTSRYWPSIISRWASVSSAATSSARAVVRAGGHHAAEPRRRLRRGARCPRRSPCPPPRRATPSAGGGAARPGPGCRRGRARSCESAPVPPPPEAPASKPPLTASHALRHSTGRRPLPLLPPTGFPSASTQPIE